MIRVVVSINKEQKIPLLISRYITALLSGMDGTDILF